VALVVRAPVGWLGPGRVSRPAEVRCEGGAIAEAGTSVRADESDDVLDIDGFLMPAGADRHVHIGLSDPMAVLLRGVTAVRDLAWPSERIFALADASELPSYSGPLVRAAGPILTGPGGYPTTDGWGPPGTGRELDGPDDAALAVAELAGRGAAAIKVSLNADSPPTPTDAELATIVETAHTHDLPVTAHCQGAGQVERALGAGIDELAHTPWTHRLSDDVVDACAKRLRVVSTLDIHSYGRETPALLTALDNLRRFHEAGGTVTYGTDLGNGPIPPGIHARELGLLGEAGLSPDEVLASLARAPLDAGAPADLIALGSDPLLDLRAFDDLRLVVRAGRLVSTR
jgi:imidazolonepropionase-like amidohydrolase